MVNRWRCLYISVLLSCIVGAIPSSNGHYPWDRHSGQSRWDRLSVTFGKFNSLPLTSKEATLNGWTRNGGCSSDTRNFFKGYRFLKDGDKTTRLLYDCDGSISGVQTTISATSNFPTKHNSRFWHKNKDGTISATAYFRDPRNICRCRKQCRSRLRHKHPVGDRLWIQLESSRRSARHIGSNPHNMWVIPLDVNGLNTSPWVKGNCFRAMGVHYHYNISKVFDCDYAVPVFLIVGKQSNKVHGFGWGVPLYVDNARWEHPPPALFARSIKPENIPECINNYKTVDVQHFYFVNPLTIMC